MNWIPTKDRLPEPGIGVLAYFPGGACRYAIAEYATESPTYAGSTWLLCERIDSSYESAWADCDPDYWMPLPAEPMPVTPAREGNT